MLDISNKKNIIISNEDALTLLKKVMNYKNNIQIKILVYLDPPYYEKGKKLYMDFYKIEDHNVLAKFLEKANNFKWILSYDNVSEIKKLYSSYYQYIFPLKYSVNTKREANELLIHSKNSVFKDNLIFQKSKGEKIFLKKGTTKNDN